MLLRSMLLAVLNVSLCLNPLYATARKLHLSLQQQHRQVLADGSDESGYVFPILLYGPHNQLRDLRGLLAAAKLTGRTLIETGITEHYMDRDANAAAIRAHRAPPPHANDHEQCFPGAPHAFLPLRNVFDWDHVSQWVGITTVTELKAGGWNGVLDAILIPEGRKLSDYDGYLHQNLQNSGVTLPETATIATFVRPNCDAKGVATLKAMLSKFKYVAMVDLPITDHVRANVDSINRTHTSQCTTAVFESDRQLRKSQWLKKAVKSFISSRIGTQNYLAVHVRPYADGCLKLWESHPDAESVDQAMDEEAAKVCSGELKTLHRTVGPHVRSAMDKSGLSGLFVMSHPAIRPLLTSLLKKEGLTAVFLEAAELNGLLGCEAPPTATLMSLVEDEIAVQSHTFVGCWRSSITEQIVLERFASGVDRHALLDDPKAGSAAWLLDLSSNKVAPKMSDGTVESEKAGTDAEKVEEDDDREEEEGGTPPKPADTPSPSTSCSPTCRGMACISELRKGDADQLRTARAYISRSSAKDTPVADRMAVMYLQRQPSEADYAKRNVLLDASLALLQRNLAPYTPLDVFIFTDAMGLQTLSAMETVAQLRQQGKLELILIPSSQWRLVTDDVGVYHDKNTWADRRHEYMVMGEWRLLVPFHLMAQLGYRYALQIDDDLYIKEPFKHNMVTEMASKGYKVANHRLAQEHDWVMHGLPELARFFLVDKHIALSDQATILSHVNPHGLEGLFTRKDNTSNEGFDRTSLYGNFLAWDLTFWTSPMVSDWVAECLLSGGMERNRWQEQAVMSLAWLLFTEEGALWQLTEGGLQWTHSKNMTRLLQEPWWPRRSIKRAMSSMSSRQHPRRTG